jgi:hypothetical protein
MKKLQILCFLSTLLVLTNCASVEEPVVPMEETAVVPPPVVTPVVKADSASKVLSKGSFMSNVHPTSGMVSVVEKAGKRSLVFTDFKTDAGPDLRIYLAENTALRNFIDVAKLDKSGNFTIELPDTADPAKQKFVIIWCKPFSVLFGNAELKCSL